MTKTILITGANRGLGLELAKQYQADDWRVLATCRKPNKAHALQDLGLNPLELNVTDSASIRSLSEKLEQEPIDILFSNAGMFGPRGLGLTEIEQDVWLDVIKVNTLAPVLVAQALVDNVAKSQDKLMVFMSSDLASIQESSGGEYIYRSSKAALNMVVATLAHDVKSRGIRTVAMSPGWVRTDMGGPNARLSTEESVRGIKTVLDELASDTSGVYLKYDGSSLAW